MTFSRFQSRPAKRMDGYTVKPRTVVLRRDPPATMCVPLPKENPWRCEAYLRIVASMQCIHCGREGQSQAAHADQGKGMGIKASDATAVPLCADSPGRPGCHSLIGSERYFSKQHRRKLETKYAAATRNRIKADGLWRPDWPECSESA